MDSKVKRGCKKGAPPERQGTEEDLLKETKIIAVEKKTYKEIKDDLLDTLVGQYEAKRKIFPTFSSLNPMLLNNIRVNKRAKYI